MQAFSKKQDQPTLGNDGKTFCHIQQTSQFDSMLGTNFYCHCRLGHCTSMSQDNSSKTPAECIHIKPHHWPQSQAMIWVPRVPSSAPGGLSCRLQPQVLCRILTWGVWVACKQCSLSRRNILCKVTCFSLTLNHKTKHKVPCAALRWVQNGHLDFTPWEKSKTQGDFNCGKLTMSIMQIACTQECVLADLVLFYICVLKKGAAANIKQFCIVLELTILHDNSR